MVMNYFGILFVVVIELMMVFVDVFNSGFGICCLVFDEIWMFYWGIVLS